MFGVRPSFTDIYTSFYVVKNFKHNFYIVRLNELYYFRIYVYN